MQSPPSSLDHLNALSIVFVAGILSAVTFITYIERMRRKAVLDHYRRENTQSNFSSVPMRRSSEA